ncbi:hypothetical protein [Phenylobacterium sp.]|uniref:hypothetical protein n=1 Tax=Phenylobacterium sp. TaxID=1871053 RepID=UPI0030F48CC3
MPLPPKPSPSRAKDFLSIEVGNWFKATATGGGVLVAPLVILLLIGAAVAQHLLF